MSYRGRATGGGPADRRDLDELTIRKLSVGPMDNNAYLLTCRATGDQLLVDAAAQPGRLLEMIRDGSTDGRLGMVVTTHRHADHHAGLVAVVAATGARVAAGAEDADALPVDVDVRLAHDEVLTCGRVRLRVVALRGHTPGSVALAYREPASVTAREAAAGRVHLFTGDSLFPGGPGRTNGPADFRSLMTDLEHRVFTVFDDRTWVYPGHGDDTTLGAERPSLADWWARGW